MGCGVQVGWVPLWWDAYSFGPAPTLPGTVVSSRAGGEAGPMGVEGAWVGTPWVRVPWWVLFGISPVGAGTCKACAGEEEC